MGFDARASRSFQGLIAALQHFWGERGCLILQPYDMEVGAGTFHPATALRSLGPQPWRFAYVQPSRRPADGRFGDNPNRFQHYHQFQVLLKPAPADICDLYLESLAFVGIDRRDHDIRFVEDDWESPTLGAWGLGWEVWCDGMEITQFTYFQQVAGFDCRPVAGEITYGLERLAMYLQGVDNGFDIAYNDAEGERRVSYGDVFARAEYEYGHYSFHCADIAALTRGFDDAERECRRLTARGLALPAYDQCIKASHLFNVLTARGAFGTAERAAYIGRVRRMSREVGAAWLADAAREKMGDDRAGDDRADNDKADVDKAGGDKAGGDG